MNCNNCSQPLDQGATFCGNCGQPVTPTTAPPNPAATPSNNPTVPSASQPLQPQVSNLAPVAMPSNPYVSSNTAPSSNQPLANTSPAPQTQVAYPYATPAREPGTARVAIILASIALVGWFLPLPSNIAMTVGLIFLLINIVALGLAIKNMVDKKKYAPIALGLAVISFLVLIGFTIFGAARYAQPSQDANNISTEQSTGDGTSSGTFKSARSYPEQTRQAFIEGCAANADRSICECMLNEIEQDVTYEEYSQAEQQYVKTGAFPSNFQQAMNNATQTCR